ncbi:dipeptidase [Natranaerofaba carboxydovora]|uniref:dipeptidase n=1 Tax=Natranaerofaba carboxydovora TaxID=2742683 RepID=UPI001F13801C|nr:dipeptidase [Natranaerofaba carboxydovora]UMZ74912.1 Membrane dipeptidase (Peptidase family M19) [Natranaerofaba carboxydovora]
MDYLEFHHNVLVVDTHNDAITHLVDQDTWLCNLNLGEGLGNKTKYGHVDIDKITKGGINVAFFSICAPERYQQGRVLDRVLALINAIYFNVTTNPDKLKLVVDGAKELEEIKPKEDKIAIVPTFEGLDMLDETKGIELLRQFNDLSIKVMSLTWNDSNQVAEGLNSVLLDGREVEPGLTSLGKKIIQEMNKLGIVIDVSHLHKNSYWDVLKVSNAPVLASHSGACGVYKHRRNFSDDELYGLADNGGVIQINFARDFLCENKSNATACKVVDHIEYAVKLIGAEHVGLGSDFDGACMPLDIDDASKYPKITQEMINRGFKEDEIEKILGKNTLRIIREVEEKSNVNKDSNNDSNNSEHVGIEMVPHFEMGTVFEDKTPLLGVTINQYDQKINESSIKAILDGCVYEPDNIDSWSHPVSKKTSKVVYLTPQIQTGGFHIITFAGKTTGGKELRKTGIFYITR